MIGRFLSKLLFWRSDQPVVALVRMKGVIAPATGGMRKSLNLEGLEPQLKKAFGLSNLTAVALVINSPGGSPVQSQLIADRVRQLATKHNVPVLAFCEDAAASGGYWLACAADEIYASPASIIGSIGVVSAGFGFPEMLEKIGVERRVYTAGTSKSMLDPFKPEKQSDIDHLKSLQLTLHDFFKDYVAQRRGARLNGDSDMLFSGAFWAGSTAQELGLIDQLGNMHKVLGDKFGKDFRLVTISAKSGFSLFQALSGAQNDAMMGQVAGQVAGQIAGQIIDSAEERFWWSRLGL